jgi:hypothetical protein
MSQAYYDFQKRVEKKRFWIELRFLWRELSVWVLPGFGIWFLVEKLSWWSLPVLILVSFRYGLWMNRWSKLCHDEREAEVKAMRAREYEEFENR